MKQAFPTEGPGTATAWLPEALSADRLLSRPEAVAYFGLSQRFLEVAAVKGNGPRMVKIGRTVRYQVADIRAWIEDQKRGSTSEGGAA